MEHVDHKYDNWVSEFVWIRTGVGPVKRFFVRDADGEKRYVHGGGEVNGEADGSFSPPSPESAAACVWFDDHHCHCTDTIDEACYSIRVDGVFTDAFRYPK